MKDPWILEYIDQAKNETQDVMHAIKNLKKFSLTKKLQEATIQYIVQHLATPDELADLQRAFTALDINNDGKITRDELLQGFQANTNEGIEEVNAIFNEVDLDGNGEIEFSEWIVASIDKNSLITQEKLEMAFKLFDKDGGGTIDAAEIKSTLIGDNSDIDDEVWSGIIDEVDMDGNGEIDFYEFCHMMRKLVIDEWKHKT